MKRFKQFRPARMAILVCTMALTACAGLSSRNTFPEPKRDASGYFYGIDCCGQNRVAFTPAPQAPAVSSLAYTVATKQASPAARDCSQLSAEITKTEQMRRTALQKQKGAWKTIVPFVVVARYTSSKSAVEQADKQLDQLHTEFSAQGCDRDASRPT